MPRKRTGTNRGRDATQRRQEVAKKNELERTKRSPLDQLTMLNKRLGDGRGAQRERARLATEIVAGPNKKRHANTVS